MAEIQESQRQAVRPYFVHDDCEGCELCADICPEVFALDENGAAIIHNSTPPPEAAPNVQEAIESCPSNRIAVR
jgi:ferredoxin